MLGLPSPPPPHSHRPLALDPPVAVVNFPPPLFGDLEVASGLLFFTPPPFCSASGDARSTGHSHSAVPWGNDIPPLTIWCVCPAFPRPPSLSRGALCVYQRRVGHLHGSLCFCPLVLVAHDTHQVRGHRVCTSCSLLVPACLPALWQLGTGAGETQRERQRQET